jgi:hypothetical protein
MVCLQVDQIWGMEKEMVMQVMKMVSNMASMISRHRKLHYDKIAV